MTTATDAGVPVSGVCVRNAADGGTDASVVDVGTDSAIDDVAPDTAGDGTIGDVIDDGLDAASD
jgi:hypothetical protein